LNAEASISTAPASALFDSVSQLGVEERELLRLTLRTTLVKSQHQFATFDALFERFFAMPLAALCESEPVRVQRFRMRPTVTMCCRAGPSTTWRRRLTCCCIRKRLFGKPRSTVLSS
jgi:uncharacterized protein with von Willebrand factor type A (vWA) domain